MRGNASLPERWAGEATSIGSELKKALQYHRDEALELGYEVHPGFQKALLPHRQGMHRSL